MKSIALVFYLSLLDSLHSTIRPTGLSARGSGFLLRKNGADQQRCPVMRPAPSR